MIRESKDKDAVSGLTWDDFKKMNLTQHVSPQALLSPSISLSQTGNPPFHIPSKNQAQFLLFVCAKVSMLATWHPCQSIQSAAETTSQEEYEALVCVPKLQVITETIRLCNPIGFSSGYVAPKGWKVICAIREAQHDPANYENPKQFNPWHHGQVHHSFCHPIRRYLHSTAQHRGSTRSTILLTEKRIAKLEREKIHA